MEIYDPGLVQIIFFGTPMVGFAEDAMVEVERNEDSGLLTVGADGRGALARNKNKSGTFKLSVLQTSPSNDILSAALAAFENGSPIGIQPGLVQDLSGRTLISAQNVWVKKVTPIKLGKEIAVNEWELETDNLDVVVGGNAAVGV